jgi:hypothetical protein
MDVVVSLKVVASGKSFAAIFTNMGFLTCVSTPVNIQVT